MSARHLSRVVEVMNRVCENVQRCGCATDVRLPLPSVILRVEEDVGAGNADAHDNQTKQYQNRKHEAIDIVDLVVAPNCRQNEIHLDEEAAKGHNSFQGWLSSKNVYAHAQPSCNHRHDGRESPMLCWNGPEWARRDMTCTSQAPKGLQGSVAALAALTCPDGPLHVVGYGRVFASIT